SAKELLSLAMMRMLSLVTFGGMGTLAVAPVASLAIWVSTSVLLPNWNLKKRAPKPASNSTTTVAVCPATMGVPLVGVTVRMDAVENVKGQSICRQRRASRVRDRVTTRIAQSGQQQAGVSRAGIEWTVWC